MSKAITTTATAQDAKASGRQARVRPKRLHVTARARRALERVREHNGPQALVLSWPSGACCVPADSFVPGRYDVIIGHVGGFPMHADIRQLEFYADRRAVLDIAGTTHRGRPVLRLQPPPPPAERASAPLVHRGVIRRSRAGG
jgi:uncharacterized protein (DUF779 family)